MKHYAVYGSDGSILRFGVCPTKDIALQAKTGENVVLFEKIKQDMDITHKVSNGTLSINKEI